MDFAFHSLFLFILFVFPGIVFRRFYYVGEFSKQFNSSNWLNTFYISLIPGLIIQIISYFVFISFIYKKPITGKYEFINVVYNKLKSNSLPRELFDLKLFFWICIYMFVTVVISFFMAQICWQLVRMLKLDKRFMPLRFNNYWHYYLSGESLSFKDFKGILAGKEAILTEADVLVDLGNGINKLYKGFIRQHTICRNTGELKAIYLTDVRRFTSYPPPNNIKVVPGHIMIIPAEKIININLNYITRNTSNIDYKSLLLIVTYLVVLGYLMFNPYMFLKNVNLLGEISGRFWLLVDWTFLITFLERLTTDRNTPDFWKELFGLSLIIILISLVLFFFFFN
ncbi:hypothetical protein IUY40_02640 [Flavobacterium sp. ALJ2]|uniref:hypothetical protein n=1 Tax=Flavobacterium sp. ALJ2 TaxID=2786960 RepID=UPI00189F8185|nr:hypothetical protein [Flavobacterium sp. ALJ2]MBF7090442.1 hypothetical protein [Flavobacterium sp. ALJ2]